MRTWQRRGRNGDPAAARQIREVFFDATRDSHSGLIYLKVANCSGSARTTRIQISGVSRIEAQGEVVSLEGKSLDDTNSIEEPRKVVPRTEKADGLSANFTREFPAYSVTVLKLKTK
jgi:alpha-N-arabinofuranosidase